MKNSKFLFTVTLVMIVVCGLTQGVVQRRWANDDYLPEASSRLQNIPRQFGHWTSEDLTLTDKEISTGRIAGYIRREYRHTQTNSMVGVLLMVGEAGPISLHPPTVCLAGQGFQMLRQPSTTSLPTSDSEQDDDTSEFFLADFQSGQSSDDLLTRLYWAWSTDAIWQAAQSPRFQFAGQPFLYKMYVTERWRPSESKKDTAVAHQFLKDFLPVVKAAIQAPSSSMETTAGGSGAE